MINNIVNTEQLPEEAVKEEIGNYFKKKYKFNLGIGQKPPKWDKRIFGRI